MHYFFGQFRACSLAAAERGVPLGNFNSSSRFLKGPEDLEGLRFVEGDTLDGVYGAHHYSAEFFKLLEWTKVKSGVSPQRMTR